MKISFIDPNLNWIDIGRAVRSLNSGWLVHGKYGDSFEDELACYLRSNDAFLTSSCTASFEIALILGNIQKDDEVITSPISWVSMSNSILARGATPVFCDVNRNDYLLDASQVEGKITPKTKAILVTHLYGQMADMRAFEALGKKYGILIIEDAAHALESSREGVRPGQLSFAACFSFHAAKNITAGQGGGLVIKSEPKLVQLARRCGVQNDQNDERVMSTFGGKYDLSDFQAALLIGQLNRIKKSNLGRERVWKFYEESVKELGIKFPQRHENSSHAFHQFVIEVDPDRRNEIRRKLKDKGIATSIHFKSIPNEPYYKEEFGYREDDFPVASAIGSRVISLPTYPSLTGAKQQFILRELEKLI
jgi:dTDP-4-amino-4,6-dideoxygalactose transaminase